MERKLSDQRAVFRGKVTICQIWTARQAKSPLGSPVVVNRSFNVRDGPIFAPPVDAFRCFGSIDLDRLAIVRYFLRKIDQEDPAPKREGHVLALF